MTPYRPTREPSAKDRAAHGGLTCWEFDNFLLDHVEGRLAPETHAQFEAHLASCPPCRAYLRDYLRTIRAIGQAYQDGHLSASKDAPAPPDAPASLISAILTAVRL